MRWGQFAICTSSGSINLRAHLPSRKVTTTRPSHIHRFSHYGYIYTIVSNMYLMGLRVSMKLFCDKQTNTINNDRSGNNLQQHRTRTNRGIYMPNEMRDAAMCSTPFARRLWRKWRCRSTSSNTHTSTHTDTLSFPWHADDTRGNNLKQQNFFPRAGCAQIWLIYSVFLSGRTDHTTGESFLIGIFQNYQCKVRVVICAYDT